MVDKYWEQTEQGIKDWEKSMGLMSNQPVATTQEVPQYTPTTTNATVNIETWDDLRQVVLDRYNYDIGDKPRYRGVIEALTLINRNVDQESITSDTMQTAQELLNQKRGIEEKLRTATGIEQSNLRNEYNKIDQQLQSVTSISKSAQSTAYIAKLNEVEQVRLAMAEASKSGDINKTKELGAKRLELMNESLGILALERLKNEGVNALSQRMAIDKRAEGSIDYSTSQEEQAAMANQIAALGMTTGQIGQLGKGATFEKGGETWRVVTNPNVPTGLTLAKEPKDPSIVLLNTGEQVKRDYFTGLPTEEQQELTNNGIEAWQEQYTIALAYVDPETGQPERVRKAFYDSLDELDKQRLNESGIEAVQGGGELYPAELEANNVQLDNGEWIAKKSILDPETGEIVSLGFEDMTPEQQQFLRVKGIEAFNKEYNQAVDTDTMNLYIRDLGGSVEEYNALASDTEKESYLTGLQTAQINNFITIADGSIETYNALPTDIEKSNYLDGLQSAVEAKAQQHQADLGVVQRYITDGQIKVDADGNYNFSGLGTKYYDNPILVSALQNLFKNPETGETIDIEGLKKAYPSYLGSYDQMTPTMIAIANDKGIAGLSLFGIGSRKKFETMQAYGLIPWNAKYQGTTENYIPSYQELQDAGLTLEQWKSAVEVSGNDYMQGQPVWYIAEGNLTKNDIDYWKQRGWGFIENNNKDMSVSIQVPQNIQHINPEAVQSIINNKYEGLKWNDLNDTEKTNVLTEYYQPSWHEKWIKGGFAGAQAFLAGGEETATVPKTPYKTYVGTVEIPPEELTGVEKWAKEGDTTERIFKAPLAGIAGLGLGFAGMVQTAGTAGTQLLETGNIGQYVKTMATIPVGIGQFISVQLPQDIIKDPIYGVGEVIGLFVLPEALKGGVRQVRASFRNVGHLGATARAYGTTTGIDFWRPGPYETVKSFMDIIPELQKEARENPNRVVTVEHIVEIPKVNAEGRYTKVGDSYVIEGTKETANNYVSRDSMAHPSAKIDDVEAKWMRDTAKADIFRKLPDGTTEHLVGKDRAGDALELLGGGLDLKGTAREQLLHELADEIGLRPEDIISIKELPPYLGKAHPYSLNGVRTWQIEVRSNFEPKLQKGGELDRSQWLRDNSTARVNGYTWDILKGVGVKVGTSGFGIVAKAGERITDITRDKTWGDRLRENRLPTESEIQATALKQRPFKNIYADIKTPQNIQTPLRISHYTSDYTPIVQTLKDGKIHLDSGGKYKEVYGTGKPTSFFSQRSISRGEPIVHHPALINFDLMPEDFIKKGVALKLEWDAPIAQYVVKIIGGRLENEVTMLSDIDIYTTKPNFASKIIEGGAFKDITASSLTDYAGPTVPVKLSPKVVEIEGAVTKLKDIKKVVFDLDGTLIDGKGKIRPYAFEILDHLKANNIDVALWTHSPYARTAQILNNTGLNRYFNIGEPRVGGIGKVRQAGITELNKTMGINENVKVREDYAKANEVDKRKAIEKINGDILIDNSAKQIRAQANYGNVALKTTTYYGGKSYDLARIQDLLSGEPMRKVETQGFDVVERGTQYKQGQPIPVLYLQSEAFKLATEELGKKSSVEAKIGDKGELYSGGELTDFIRDKAILRGKSLPNGIRLQDTAGQVWEKVGSIWASVDKTGAIGREFASINSLDGANIVARSVVVNVPTYLKDLRTGIKNAKPESLSEVWENTMDIPNRAINETINKVGDVRKAGEVELSKEMGTLVEGQPFKNPYLVSAKSLYALKGIALKENVRDILTGKVRPKPIGFSWKGSGDSPFRNVSKSWGLKTEGLDKWGGKGAKESARPKFKSEAEEAIYKDKVDAGIIKEEPVSGEPMPEHMLEGFGTQGFGEGGKGIWGSNIIEGTTTTGTKAPAGISEVASKLAEAKTVVFDLDGTLVRMSSDWTGGRATIRPNVTELLDYLQANDRKIGLWTHSTYDRANAILKNTGLDKYFDINNKEQVRTRYDYAKDDNPSAYKNIGEIGEKAVLIDDLAAQIEQQNKAGNYAIKTSTYYGSKSSDMSRILDEFKKADETKVNQAEPIVAAWVKSVTPSRYNDMSPREYAEEYVASTYNRMAPREYGFDIINDAASIEYRLNNAKAVEAEMQRVYTETKPKTEGTTKSISEQMLEERGIEFDVGKELAHLESGRPEYIVDWDTIRTVDTSTSGNIKLGGAGHIENNTLKGVHITRTPEDITKVLDANGDISIVKQWDIEGSLGAKGLYFSDVPKVWDRKLGHGSIEGIPRIEVPVEVTGKFADITEYKGYIENELIDALKEKGYDGILDRGGRTDAPQVIVWNTKAVKRYGEWRSDESKSRITEEPFKDEYERAKAADEAEWKSTIGEEAKYRDEGASGGKYKIGLREPLGALLVSGGDEYAQGNSSYDKEMEAIKKEDESLESYKPVEEIVGEEVSTEEITPEEVVSEEVVSEEKWVEKPYIEEQYIEKPISEEMATEESVPEEVATEETAPEEVATEGTYPEESAIEGSYPQEGATEGGYAPEETPTEGGYPNEPTPPYSGYGEKPPPTGGGGVLLKVKGEQLSKEQREAAIGWKQGIMFKYRYPPWGQDDIINSRTPIQGIPIKKGMRSAYESIIRTMKGTIPPNLVFHMGMMDTVITDADKNGQPEIAFVEKEQRKGRGSVAPKASITRL